MKRVVVGCSVAAITMVLLVSCRNSKNKQNNNISTTTQIGKTPMSRTKNPSGLEYIILQEGTGACPTAGRQVTVHYTGWLDNNGEPGKKFDSSIDRGQPFSFIIGIGQVIQGWDEGVMTMKVGEKRRIFIPSNLGYGARGAGSVIPPHAHLIFDVELLKV